MSRRRVLALVVAVLGALALLAPVPGVGAAGPLAAQGDEGADAGEDSGPDPFDSLAGCISTTGRLLVVLLVDESGSLNSTDPEDQRVAGAQAAVDSLDRLRQVDVGGVTPTVDIQVAVFSNDFTALGPWERLDGSTLPSVQRRVQALEDRDDGRDTDFHNALDGARASLAERAVAANAGEGGETCKAVLLFTDGDFAIGPRTGAEELERYGETKVYAPDIVLDSDEAVRDARQKGIDALCDEGGVADQLRGDQVTLITVPLTNKLREGAQRLIEAITTGEAVDRTCGDPESDSPGVYLPAADPEDLLRVFDGVGARIGGGALAGDEQTVTPCAEEPCDEGTVEVEVTPSQSRVRIFVTTGAPGSRVVLAPPDGDALEVEAGTDVEEEVAGIPVTAEWLSERSVAIDLAVPPDGTGAGTWRVSVIGPDEGGDGGARDAEAVIQVITFSDLVVELVDATSLQLGEEVELVTRIVSRSGAGEVPEFAASTVTASIVDPITGRSIITDSETGAPKDLLLAPEGDTFVGTVTVPDDVTAAAVGTSFRLQATTEEGAVLTSVSPDVDLPVRRPDGYPQLSPPKLELSSIEGAGRAEGELVLVKGSGKAGCAWLDDLEVRSAPKEAEGFTVEVQGIGRSESDCTEITAPLSVPISIEPGERASGRVNGHVRLYLAESDGAEPIATDVPVSFEMAEGVDEAKRLALAAGLLLGGLLLPLLLLFLINLATTRFSNLDHVRAAKIPVAVLARGQIVRTDGNRRALRLLGGDFHPLEGDGDSGSHRSFTWGGLRFRARTSLNPFGAPHAVVSPEGGTADVSREGRRTDLALGLTGSWLFLLDQDATRAASERVRALQSDPDRTSDPAEIHGHIVAFIAEGPVPAQASRLVEDVDERLPRTARELARIAKI